MAWDRPPSEYANCNEWQAWYNDLEKEFGKKEAVRQFTRFFTATEYGTQTCMREDKFRKWTKRKGMVGLESGWTKAYNLAGSWIKWLKRLGIIAIIVAVLVLLFPLIMRMFGGGGSSKIYIGNSGKGKLLKGK